MDAETQKHIDVESITYNTQQGGPQTGPLILLSHALMANLHMWDGLIPHLHLAGYRTLRYDHVGHGGTSPPTAAESFHFDDYTRHMHALVQAANNASDGVAAVHAVIGCSMGGVLALRYSMLYPASVRCVIACDAPGLDALELAKPKWAARVAEFKARGSGELCRATVERWFPPPCDESVKIAALAQVRTCSFEGYRACADAIQTYRYRDELGRVGARTMILVGENDEAVGPREVLVDVAARVREAEHVCMKDAGHLPPMHRPDEFARVVLGFLGSLG